MLFFKKNKPALKDLIPEGYVDIHSHLLFGIDDGAQTFEDTLFLTKSMIDYGVSEFITTPHTLPLVWDNTHEGITAKHDETLLLLKQSGIDSGFSSASEYLMDDNFAKRFKSEPLLTLKDNYVLVEMSYINAPLQLMEILFDLQIAGYKPVLAHPERYMFYHWNYNQYKVLKKAGCLFQLNLLSTVGYYGEAVFQITRKLLEEGMIDFVGSDVHHKKHIEAFNNPVNFKDLSPLKTAFGNNSLFSHK